MKLKIGFCDSYDPVTAAEQPAPQTSNPKAVASLVEVAFPDVYKPYTYYNDSFDLHVGDAVYVDGKLEGKLGRVVAVNQSFKIKLSDYKKVIALVDTHVKGTFHAAGAHMVTFDPKALPPEQAFLWFLPPCTDEYVYGHGDASFPLSDLSKMNISISTAERGAEYYTGNKVRYLCLDGTHGYAIVQGSQAYEVEFFYDGTDISDLTCSCYCFGHCKHSYATMLQLRELLEKIMKHYKEAYEEHSFFAAIYAPTLFDLALLSKENRSVTF